MMLTRDQIQVKRVTYPDMDIEEQWWAEEVTKWDFTLPVEVAGRIHQAVCNRLIDMSEGTYRYWCGPSLGEFDVDFAWATIDLPGSLVQSIQVRPLEGKVEVWIHNRPQDPDDIIDPDHIEWSTGSPLQWIDVASFIKQFLTKVEEVKW